jgi:hypothetical protein
MHPGKSRRHLREIPGKIGRSELRLPVEVVDNEHLVGAARGRERCPFNRPTDFPQEPGDVIDYMSADPNCEADTPS